MQTNVDFTDRLEPYLSLIASLQNPSGMEFWHTITFTLLCPQYSSQLPPIFDSSRPVLHRIITKHPLERYFNEVLQSQVAREERKMELTPLYISLMEMLAELAVSVLVQQIIGSPKEKMNKLCQWLQSNMVRGNMIGEIGLLTLHVSMYFNLI